MDAPSNMRSAGLNFAERQMQRHGWTEGKGLGKREDGISKAIKVKVKCDTAGVGHNSAEQFTFHWWDHVFNKTASSISVETDEDGVKVKKVSGNDGAVSSKKPRKAMLNNNMLYGRFIKSATLMSGGEKPVEESSSSSSSSEGSEDEDSKLDLSSATKGARHGLTMSAKLFRIEEQEKEFMEKYGKKETKVQLSKSGVKSMDCEDEKKDKWREGKFDDGEQDNLSEIFSKKKKKKQSKETCEEAPNSHAHVPCMEDDTRTSKKRVGLVEEAEVISDNKNDHQRLKKKKKTAKSEESISNGHSYDEEMGHKFIEDKARKSKKKKRTEDHEELVKAKEKPSRKSKNKKWKVDDEGREEHDLNAGERRSRLEKKKLVDKEDHEEHTRAKKKKKSKHKD
ncbi:G patch domain-containing protein 4 isoform X2 [Phyllobates terribilis]|uniref:G patch domain-containing protein 4 isoform X2 n=1 Tax=Phyllobates terribilis TaxID=111132 RepID=UPI003CCB49F6